MGLSHSLDKLSSDRVNGRRLANVSEQKQENNGSLGLSIFQACVYISRDLGYSHLWVDTLSMEGLNH